MGPTDTIASKTVVVTVYMVIHVTRKLVFVIKDAHLDIVTLFAAKVGLLLLGI